LTASVEAGTSRSGRPVAFVKRGEQGVQCRTARGLEVLSWKDHTNKVFERIEKNVLPFFSKNLSFEGRTPATKH
jgi:hypothetical protein